MKRSVSMDQQRKAHVYFVLILCINISIFSIIVAGIILGIHEYISDTKSIYKTVTCCGSICTKCFFTLHTVFTIVPWISIAVLAVGICMAIRKALSVLLSGCHFFHSLAHLPTGNNAELNKILSKIHPHNEPILLDHPRLLYAFTSGLWRPEIYLSTGICSYLTQKELLVVILHEVHHKLTKVPLKLFIMQILSALNFFLPINKHLITLYSSASEKAADDAAISVSGEPLELASALVKLSQFHAIHKQGLSIAFSKEQGIVEDRLRRILLPETFPPCLRNTYVYLSSFLSFFIAVAVCLLLFYKPCIDLHTTECKAKACHMDICGDYDHASVY